MKKILLLICLLVIPIAHADTEYTLSAAWVMDKMTKTPGLFIRAKTDDVDAHFGGFNARKLSAGIGIPQRFTQGEDYAIYTPGIAWDREDKQPIEMFNMLTLGHHSLDHDAGVEFSINRYGLADGHNVIQLGAVSGNEGEAAKPSPPLPQYQSPPIIVIVNPVVVVPVDHPKPKPRRRHH